EPSRSATVRQVRRMRDAGSAPASLVLRVYGLQPLGLLESGSEHSGPRPVLAFGRLMNATGPAWCSPLNGVNMPCGKPHGTASAGSLNQKPTWNVFVGARLTSGSKPKI